MIHTAATDILSPTRRRFMAGGLATASLLIISPAFAALPQGRRTLAFRNLHTDEELKLTYWADGKYINGALDEINKILRDHRTGDIKKMDVSLINLLHDLKKKVGSDRPFEVISAYRSPQSNAKLHEHSSGVAKKSYHLQGKAIDINLRDRSLSDLHRAAKELGRGGVGMYAKSGFIHVDTGHVRYW